MSFLLIFSFATSLPYHFSLQFPWYTICFSLCLSIYYSLPSYTYSFPSFLWPLPCHSTFSCYVDTTPLPFYSLCYSLCHLSPLAISLPLNAILSLWLFLRLCCHPNFLDITIATLFLLLFSCSCSLLPILFPLPFLCLLICLCFSLYLYCYSSCHSWAFAAILFLLLFPSFAHHSISFAIPYASGLAFPCHSTLCASLLAILFLLLFFVFDGHSIHFAISFAILFLWLSLCFLFPCHSIPSATPLPWLIILLWSCFHLPFSPWPLYFLCFCLPSYFLCCSPLLVFTCHLIPLLSFWYFLALIVILLPHYSLCCSILLLLPYLSLLLSRPFLGHFCSFLACAGHSVFLTILVYFLTLSALLFHFLCKLWAIVNFPCVILTLEWDSICGAISYFLSPLACYSLLSLPCYSSIYSPAILIFLCNLVVPLTNSISSAISLPCYSIAILLFLGFGFGLPIPFHNTLLLLLFLLLFYYSSPYYSLILLFLCYAIPLFLLPHLCFCHSFLL